MFYLIVCMLSFFAHPAFLTGLEKLPRGLCHVLPH